MRTFGKPYEPIKFWCFKVLPLVYDESLSYYEVLCKCAEKLNEIIKDMQDLPETLKEIEDAIAQIEEWIRTFDTSVIEKWIDEHLATMIFVEINDAGYFVIHVPEHWEDITFKTSGWDYSLEPPLDYGHLVLIY